uniref:TF-B3 domain-containing protein n=1 Tax=Davidia involucrata TaxID=16924 RepID=A0A5B7BYH2_DAVIN
MDPLASVPGNEVENPRMEHPQAQPVLNHTTTKLEGNEFWPLSGKPFFHLILSKSHVKPSYYLVFPAKIHSVLPCATVPGVLTYRDKNWEIAYIGDRGCHKRLDTNWKTFASDNDLKVGDACVFELMECSSTNIKFRVQILRGDFPSELLARVNGETSNTPIVID